MWLNLGKLVLAVVICIAVSGVDLTPAFAGRDSFGRNKNEGDPGCGDRTYQRSDGAKKGPLADCMQQK